ncbi:hypothetical protein LshimejAT787_2200420 [Lyophyllum shimeji]|uniref:Uncharacterized protein n=1 Tax=Lyophyllum shimeji TaxID=47721 RepID=A0A9P3Q1C9_LYOSH|nr:hypothetical protein LshimejAT787_2200420 [Lyophyllum shimeji]
MKKIEKTIEKIPGLGPLIEKIADSIAVLVFTTIEPFMKPILKTTTAGLSEISGEVIDSHDQYEVFNDPRASDPTHSFLSKDYFESPQASNLILNEPAGLVAKVVVANTVQLVTKAWDDTSVNLTKLPKRFFNASSNQTSTTSTRKYNAKCSGPCPPGSPPSGTTAPNPRAAHQDRRAGPTWPARAVSPSRRAHPRGRAGAAAVWRRRREEGGTGEGFIRYAGPGGQAQVPPPAGYAPPPGPPGGYAPLPGPPTSGYAPPSVSPPSGYAPPQAPPPFGGGYAPPAGPPPPSSFSNAGYASGPYSPPPAAPHHTGYAPSYASPPPPSFPGAAPSFPGSPPTFPEHGHGHGRGHGAQQFPGAAPGFPGAEHGHAHQHHHHHGQSLPPQFPGAPTFPGGPQGW